MPRRADRAGAGGRELAVLGIDAAWTPGRPSGVALALRRAGCDRLIRVAPSYAVFAGLPDAGLDAVVDVAARLAGRPVDIVAVDMPLSNAAVTGRRVADNLVASAFGGRGIGTHTPRPDRPGSVAENLHDRLASRGYTLATGPTPAGTVPALVEVFPHTALLSLCRADYRLPYKMARAGRYWPGLTPAERRRRLLARWAAIIARLDSRMADAGRWLRPADPPTKTFEDMLDAAICAWAGLCYGTGAATAFGDATAAIWVPRV